MSTVTPSLVTTMREASGDLTAAETSTPFNTNDYSSGAVLLNVTKMTAAAGEEVDFYLQTSYDSGTTWTDIECIHFDNADNGSTSKRIMVLTPNRPTAADVSEASTDGAIADDTKIDIAIGGQLRFKVAITNTPTYAYTASAVLRA